MKKNCTNIKDILKYIAILILVSSSTLFIACASTTSSTTNSITAVGNPDFELPTGTKAFYSPASDTTPVIVATTSLSTLDLAYVSTDWSSGNPTYEIFNIFQDYQHSRDQGVIDVSNIYKLLYDAGDIYENALNEVVALSSATTIESPFDFGNTARTYTHASNNHALAQEGDTIYALLTWTVDETPKISYGVIEGSHNATTGDITLDMVYYIDYVGDSDYCLRTYLTGNELTHTFTIKAAKCATVTGNYAVSLIGSGISQSDDEEDYFLLKLIDNDNLSNFNDGRYYKFTTTADEEELQAHAIDGYELSEITDPNDYATTIDAFDFFDLNGTDHATSLSDFTDSSLTLDF